MEAVLGGMVEAFEFFGCVPREVWWDNPKTVVQDILKGRERRMNQAYAALASHYAFEPLFCMPARGNEKPYVENRVFDLQRRWATPVPRVQDFLELNAYLRQCCMDERRRTVAGRTETIGQRFEQDRQAAMPLPSQRFDPCILSVAQADKYQTVAYDSNRYSVPRRWAFETVTVKAYVDRIQIVACGQVVATHRRCYGRRQQVLDPLHYLVTLGRRPAALDHSKVYRNWELPASFAELRTVLEGRHGPFAGSRQYIRVLQLLAEHPMARVQRAIDHCLQRQLLDAELIRMRVSRLAAGRAETTNLEPLISHQAVQVQVPRPDLSRFNQLLRNGEPTYD